MNTNGLAPEITLEEAAKRLGVHYMTAYRYVRMGTLRATKVGGQWRVRGDALDEFVATAQKAPHGRGGSGRDYATQLLRALCAGDDPTAWQIVSDALASAHTMESLYTEVLSATMHEVGDLWERGMVTVAQEHLATAAMTRIIGRLSPLARRRGPSRGAVVLCCPQDDTHSLATALVADPIRHRGFSVFDLGGCTPVESVINVCQGHPVIAVGVIASAPITRGQIEQLLARIHDRIPIPVLVGGAGIDPADDPVGVGAAALITSTPQALDWLEAAVA